MSHFAKVENGIVTDVIVAEQDFIDTLDGTWVQTSYNTHGGVHYGQDGQPDGGVPLRKNYAGIGMIYDADRDAFYIEQPYPSWSLNETTCLWESPVPVPEWAKDAASFKWDEANQEWVEVTE